MTSIPVLGMAKKPSNETQKLTLRSSRFPFFFFFAFLILLPSFYRIHRTLFFFILSLLFPFLICARRGRRERRSKKNHEK